MLREGRIAAGYTSQDALGKDLPMERSGVTKIETGKRVPTNPVLTRWCGLCHLDYRVAAALAKIARQADSIIPLWFGPFREVVLIAYTIRAWHPFLVPGLLQTCDYARALFEGTDEEDRVEELVAARLEMQQILNRTRPARLYAVMDEAVLHRHVGGPEVMHRQLVHLYEQGQCPHISIQVVPARNCANVGSAGGFTIASVHGASDVVLAEALEDVTSDARRLVLKAHAVFDRVRSDALPQRDSLEFIREMAEKCQP